MTISRCFVVTALAFSISANGEAPGFDELTGYMNRACAELHLKGAAVIVGRADGTVLYRHFFGEYSAGTVLPVASVTKWWSAATIETLVERKLIDLDRPITAYLADVPADKAGITVRQTLSHTSGLPKAGSAPYRKAATLQEAARFVLTLPLFAPPGTAFQYNGSAMQVAGAIAEKVSGKPWGELFDRALIKPLELSQTTYGETRQPALAGGISTSADDLARFVSMLANEGRFRGRVVLKPESVTDLEHNVAGKANRFHSYTGGPVTMAGYNLGNWCEVEEPGGNCLRASSYGANGTYPWIDRRRHIFGVFFVLDVLARDEQTFKTVREMAEKVVDAR